MVQLRSNMNWIVNSDGSPVTVSFGDVVTFVGGSGGTDQEPTAFSFPPVESAPLSERLESEEVTITGINAPVEISITPNGEYSLDGGLNWKATSDIIANGQAVRMRLTTSDQSLNTQTVTLTVGGVSADWVVTTGNFWGPALVREHIPFSFFQEDVPVGEVASWPSRGWRVKTAAQANVANRPTKLANKGGVFFAKGSTQNLQFGVDIDQPNQGRWWLCICRADMANNPGTIAQVLSVNGVAANAFHRQPMIRFEDNTAQAQLVSRLTDTITNATVDASQGDDYDGNLANWNIVVGWRRGWQHQAVINGTKTAGILHRGWTPNNTQAATIIGSTTAHPADMAIDCFIVGQGIPSDAFIDKLVGWAHWRVGRQDMLAANHPYKNAAPTGAFDINDFPTLYTHNQVAYDAWEALPNGTGAGEKFEFRGDALPAADETYSTIFFDDFLVDSVVDDIRGAPGSIWYAPTYLTNIGQQATALLKTGVPSCYIHDATGTGTMAMRLQTNAGGNWVTGAFSSVNKSGQGRTFTKGRVRVKFKLPLHVSDADRPGFFPAFWSYGIQHLFYRTRNRIENDFWEYDGLNGKWINISQHVHVPTRSFDPEASGILQDGVGQHEKVAGYPLTVANGFDPDILVYDGEFHEYEVRLEDDFTYYGMDGKEIARVPTIPELIIPWHFMLDLALDPNKGLGAPNTASTYDFTIDWVRVEMKEADLAVVPVAFNARPVLSGARGLGNTITVSPNVTANQVEIYWYADGEPIVAATNSLTFVDTADSEEKNLRCSVRALSLVDQPMAWTAELEAEDTVVAVPQNTVAPTLTGSGDVSDTHVLDLGTWTGSPTQYTYRKFRAGVIIGSDVTVMTGADVNITLDAADVGFAVHFRILATNAGGNSTGINTNTITVQEAAESTWVAEIDGEKVPFHMDAANNRAWYIDTEYTLAEFFALPAVGWNTVGTPNVVAGRGLRLDRANPVYMRFGPVAGKPFSIWDDTEGGVLIVKAEIDDALTGSQGSLIWASDGTAANGVSFQVRHHLAVASTTHTTFSGGIGSGQTAATSWRGLGRQTVISKWADNKNIFMIDINQAVVGIPANQPDREIPVGVSRLDVGSRWDRSLSNLFQGHIAEIIYKPGDVSQARLEQYLGKDVITLRQTPMHNLLDNDSIDIRAITGGAEKYLLSSNGNGTIYWYEDSGLGAEHVINATPIAGFLKIEGCCWADPKGDGNWVAYFAVCTPSSLAVEGVWCAAPDTPGDYDGTWTLAKVTDTAPRRAHTQDVWAEDLRGDGEHMILFTHEGHQAGAGGIFALEWKGAGTPNLLDPASYHVHTIKQKNGAYAFHHYRPDGTINQRVDLAGNGAKDIILTSRITDNPAAVSGVFWYEMPAGIEGEAVGTAFPAWPEEVVVQSPLDWKHATIGDFFGDGAQKDILAQRGGQSQVAQVHAFRFSSAWAETIIPIPFLVRFNVINAGFEINGKDAFLACGEGVGVLMGWDGVSSFTVAKQWNGPAAMKWDDVIQAIDFDGTGELDYIGGDSINKKIVIFRNT